MCWVKIDIPKMELENYRDGEIKVYPNFTLAEYEPRGLRLLDLATEICTKTKLKDFVLYDYKGGISSNSKAVMDYIFFTYSSGFLASDGDELVIYWGRGWDSLMVKKTDRQTVYSAYIKSEVWNKRRVRALKIAEYRCTYCESSERLEVHHLTYDNFMNEPKEDLVALCHQCHMDEHKKTGMRHESSI